MKLERFYFLKMVPIDFQNSVLSSGLQKTFNIREQGKNWNKKKIRDFKFNKGQRDIFEIVTFTTSISISINHSELKPI